jgi:signal transduction histidine kinase
VVFYANDGQAIATTLGTQNTDPEFLQTLSIPSEEYQVIVNSQETTSGENFTVDDRSYSLARGPLRVGNDRIGSFAVVLPLNYVLQSGAVSRNTYVLLFSAAMIGVVLIGYAISRLIINPLSALLRTSQAISGGDLSKRSGIRGTDEIGMLANTFDEMTGNLQERTAELERTNLILERMDRTKVSFIEVSGHELRTPLTLVKGYTQMLQQKSNGDPEIGALVSGILDGTDRMNEIVTSMLDVSKIDSKTLRVMPDNTVQIALLVMRAQKIFQPALEERKLTLNTQGLSNLPVLYADPDLLSKVFYHLIMNAIKYTPDGGEITISAHTLLDDPEAPEVEIVVCDTGVGIAPENHELIFEKFFQTGEVLLHSSGKTKFKGGGPGLGLAIVRGIVEAHHGRIWVESSGYDEKTYPGSRFHVCLPVTATGIGVK